MCVTPCARVHAHCYAFHASFVRCQQCVRARARTRPPSPTAHTHTFFLWKMRDKANVVGSPTLSELPPDQGRAADQGVYPRDPDRTHFYDVDHPGRRVALRGRPPRPSVDDLRSSIDDLQAIRRRPPGHPQDDLRAIRKRTTSSHPQADDLQPSADDLQPSADDYVDNLVDERQMCNLQGLPHCLVHRHSSLRNKRASDTAPGPQRRFVHRLGHLRTTCGSSVDILEEAALAAILMYCGTSPPPCSELPPSMDGWKGEPWPSVDDLGPPVDACGHLETTLWPSGDDPVAIRGRHLGPSVDDLPVLSESTGHIPFAHLDLAGVLRKNHGALTLDVSSKRTRPTVAGGSANNFLADLVVRSIRTDASVLEDAQQDWNINGAANEAFAELPLKSVPFTKCRHVSQHHDKDVLHWISEMNLRHFHRFLYRLDGGNLPLQEDWDVNDAVNEAFAELPQFFRTFFKMLAPVVAT